MVKTVLMVSALGVVLAAAFGKFPMGKGLAIGGALIIAGFIAGGNDNTISG
jgi:hypothetical protein